MAASTRWRTRTSVSAMLLAIFMQVVNGYEETFTISQLSPKSVIKDQSPLNELLQTSQTENMAFRIEPSISHDVGEPQVIENYDSEDHIIVDRSEDTVRSSRAIHIDDIPSSNNEIDNFLELHNKRKYYDIHPTKTRSYLNREDEPMLSSEGFGDRLEFRFPGEAKRVPKARALAPMGPRIRPTAVQPIFATATPRDGARQNPADIQNIITGLVKLLNGNVNVQANSQLLRPGRPMASRINNRGPPRISDVPPIPEFDGPITPPALVFHPTKSPPPYPFDRPPVHVNLPEQIVPPLNRPGFHRPMPPWQRPRPRPPNRRPNPGLPVYKPLPPIPDIPDIPDAEDKPNDNEANENETTHSENTIHNDDQSNSSQSSEVTVSDIDDEEKEETTTDTETTTSSTSTTTSTTTTTTTEASTTQKSTTKPPTTTEITTTTAKPSTTEKPTTTEKPSTTEKPTTTTEKKIEKSKVDKKKDTVLDKDKPKDKVKLEEKPSNKTKDDLDQVIQIVQPSIEIRPSSTVSIASPTPTEGLISVAPTANVSASEETIETSSINSQPIPTSSQSPGISYHPYRPRPGIVLDDTDFKPHGTRYRPEASVITAVDTRPPGYGEIFDVTVSAIQGLGAEKGGASVHIENVNIGHGSGHEHDDIIVSASGEQGFVSIDGKRTYLNLFDTSTPGPTIRPTQVQTLPQSVPPIPPPPLEQSIGTGVAIPTEDVPPPPPIRRPAQHPHHPHHPQQPHHPPLHRPQQGYRRPQPTVRIDTCIVGDDSTCDQAQNEKCRTEAGISSCQCRPGYARRIHRDPCRRVVSLLLNIRVDKFHDRKVAWDPKLADKDSDPYQQLSYEAVRAVDSAFSMTPFSDDFVSGSVNAIRQGDEDNPGVYVNFTVLMQETPETGRPAVAGDILKHLLGVIRRRSNNIGSSALWVSSPAGSVLPLHDVDECSSPDLNDCHQLATCTNAWGGFKCACPDSTLDPAPGTRPGRDCKSCASSHCNERGVCKYSSGQPYCSCSSGYYGSTCEVDGEVVGVAVGASLAAALVIALTLAALMSWSRKWSREQKAAGMGSPIFNYMAANTIKTPPVGQPPYQVTLEERMRWAQIAEAMAQASHYAPDAGQSKIATRPSSAMFAGYPTLPPVPLPSYDLSYRMGLHHPGTMNSVASRANTSASHHNLYGYNNQMACESTSSEASSHVQERADLLVPRPKSRARSLHNQTGIYYDVDYENAPEAIYGTKGIPLSTYTVSRGPPFYRS